MDVRANSADAALQALVGRLHATGRLRVWSLVITIFGDMIVPRGGRVALSVLQEITGRLGVEAGALRTAMSRLAADGWVRRERAGRNAFYRLADGGRHAFDLATRRIYAAGPPGWNGGWTVVIAPPGFAETDAADAASLGFVRVSAGVYLRPETKGAPGLQDAFAGTLVVHGSSAEHPETLAALWPSQHTADAYRAFLSAFSPLAEALAQGTSFRGLDAAAVRALLIHDWRRIALRDPGLPAALLPAVWPGEQARALVRAIYSTLLPESEAWLDAQRLPRPADPLALAARFGAQSSR